MDTEKAPDPVHLITFLRVLGFRERKKEPSISTNPPKKDEYRIEINCANPLFNVKMEFPDITSLEANQIVANDGGDLTVPCEIPGSKLKVVKEVFGMLMEFLLEQDGAIKRKDKILEQQQWRRCMSLDTLGSPTPRFCLPLKIPHENRNGEQLLKESVIKIVTVDTDEGWNNDGLKPSIVSNETSALSCKREEAMEVDVPPLNRSSLPDSNLSPIGLARQRTWVLESSKSEKREFDKAKTSTPTRTHITAKIGLNTSHTLSKILRPRQARTEVQPQRLRSANTETVRLMTQMKNAKELSSRTVNKSKNSSVSSISSFSSHSSVDTSRFNASHKASLKLSVPARTPSTQSLGAKPKQLSHLGVSHQSSVSSGSSTSAGMATCSRRLVSVPQVKREGGIPCTTHMQKKEEKLPLKVKPSEPEELRDGGDKRSGKRPSLLPRLYSTQKNLPASKGPKQLGKI